MKAPMYMPTNSDALPVVHLPSRYISMASSILAFRATSASVLPKLTARAENHVRGNPDLDDTIARLQAYQEAGANVLYAPGLDSAQGIRAVCEAVSKPVNVLALPNLSVADIVDAGARRISIGGGLAWIAMDSMAAAATAILDTGDLSSLTADDPFDRWLAGRS